MWGGVWGVSVCVCVCVYVCVIVRSYLQEPCSDPHKSSTLLIYLSHISWVCLHAQTHFASSS